MASRRLCSVGIEVGTGNEIACVYLSSSDSDLPKAIEGDVGIVMEKNILRLFQFTKGEWKRYFFDKEK